VVRGQACARGISEVILHHTWSPTASQYRGIQTIKGIHNYHVNERGWSDIGYHYLVAPNGAIWLGRPLSRDGGHVLGRNSGTIGVSLILNGDVELPKDAQIAAVAALLGSLFSRFGIRAAENFIPGKRGFHRHYADKSCPGTLITESMVLGWLLPSVDGHDAEDDDGPDVAEWAAESVDYCVKHELLGGYPDGTFKGDRPMTRQEVACVIARLHKALAEGSDE